MRRPLSREPGQYDMTSLEEVTEETVIANLLTRFNGGRVFTSIDTICVAVNQYDKADLCPPDVMRDYTVRSREELPPHILASVSDAVQNLSAKCKDQSIILLGESGSGKSEFSKLVLKYMLSTAKVNEKYPEMKANIIRAFAVVQMFTGCKMNSSANSTRYGFHIGVNFCTSQTITGGTVKILPIDRSRVVSQSAKEENFSLFGLLVNSPQGKLYKLIPKYDKYKYLSGPVDAQPDGLMKFQLTLLGLGFTPEMIDAMWKVVAGILHLGNIEFKKETKNSITNVEELKNAAEMFGIPSSSLEKILIGAEGAASVEEAQFMKDSIAKFSYIALLEWVVKKINSIIRKSADAPAGATLNLLEVPGFEDLPSNTFDQLCINHLNDKLVDFFFQKELHEPQLDYVENALDWTHVEFRRHSDAISLVDDAKNGLVSLLCDKDAPAADTENGEKSLLQSLRSKFSDNKSLVIPGEEEALGTNQIRVRHAAYTVMYDVSNFRRKANEVIPEALLTAMTSSTNAVAKEAFGDRPRSCTTPAGLYVLAWINETLELLKRTRPHFITCIRSNSQQEAKKFESDLVMRQVSVFGLVPLIKIKSAGWSLSLEHTALLERYMICTRNIRPPWKPDLKTACASLFTQTGIDAELYTIGKNKMFFKDNSAIIRLDCLREKARDDVAKIIQKRWRAVRQRRMRKDERPEMKILRAWRQYRARRFIEAILRAYKIHPRSAPPRCRPVKGDSVSSAPKVLKPPPTPSSTTIPLKSESTASTTEIKLKPLLPKGSLSRMSATAIPPASNPNGSAGKTFLKKQIIVPMTSGNGSTPVSIVPNMHTLPSTKEERTPSPNSPADSAVDQQSPTKNATDKTGDTNSSAEPPSSPPSASSPAPGASIKIVPASHNTTPTRSALSMITSPAIKSAANSLELDKVNSVTGLPKLSIPRKMHERKIKLIDPKYAKWPEVPKGLDAVGSLFRKMYVLWRLSSMSENIRQDMRRKIVVALLFDSRKQWDMKQKFIGNRIFDPSKSDIRPKLFKFLIRLGKSKDPETFLPIAVDFKRVTRKAKLEDSSFLVTDKRIWVVNQISCLPTRRPSMIEDVARLTISASQDSILILHMADGDDIIMKLKDHETLIEITILLLEIVSAIASRFLPVEFARTIECTDKKRRKFMVDFTEATDASCAKDILVEHVKKTKTLRILPVNNVTPET